MSNNVFPSSLMGFDIKVVREALDSVRADESASRKEVTSTWSTYPRYRYQVDFNILRSDSIMASSVRDFEWQQFCTHIARHFGRLNSFLFTDPDDSSVSDHGFAVGDGVTTAFQLQRTLQGDILDAYGEWAASSKPRTNYVLRSQQFANAAWTKRGVCVATDNVDFAPDGTATASRIVGLGATGVDDIFQTLTSSRSNGTVVAASIWIKRVSTSGTLNVRNPNGSGGLYAIDLAAIGSGWVRIMPGATGVTVSQSFVVAGGVHGIHMHAASGSLDVLAWQAQSEYEASPTQAIPTTSAVVTVTPSYWPAFGDGFEPVFDMNGPVTITLEADGLGKRAIVPWSRTNLALQSEAFDNASWTKSANASVTANATTAPDGTVTADKLIESTTTATVEHYAEQAIAISASLFNGNAVFAKAAERTWAYVSIVKRDAATVVGAYFNLATGVIGTVEAGVVAAIVDCGNGWYRCLVVGTVGTGGSNPRIRVQIASADNVKGYTGVIGSGIYVWGADSEQTFAGVQVGDHIGTATVTVTRTDYTIASGVVTTAVAPRAANSTNLAAVLAWTGSFFRRVRFDMDAFGTTRLFQSMYEAKSVQLISTK